jgi:integrase/recombinase XerD
MTSHPLQRPISALRTRMIEDMIVRGFNEKTRNDYVRNVRALAAFIGRSPDTATAEDLRLFQLHQTQSGMQPPSMRGLGAAFLLHGDTGPAGSGTSAHRRAAAAAATGGAQRRGGGAAASGGTRTEVQGGARHRLRRWAAPLRSSRTQGRRCRFRAHAATGRARQGAQEPALAKAGDRHAMLSPQPLELLRAWWREGWRRSLLLPRGRLFPGRNPVEPLSARQFNCGVR